MKKYTAAILLSGLALTSSAFAGTATPNTAVTLVNGYNALGDVATNINVARSFTLTPIANRAGFIKNGFEVMLSANVIAGLNDSAATNTMGVVAGSNKGYNVFTGSSVGGSVTQCGTTIAKDTTNLAASAVVTGTIVLANANACGRN